MHELDVTGVLKQLHTEVSRGLSDGDVEARRREHGANELEDRGSKSPWKILWEQMTASLVVILILAAVVSAFLGDFKNAIAISAIVILNTIMGFVQEYRAEKAMAALKKLDAPRVRVRRNGDIKIIPAREIVPGDLILLEAGNLVPADARVVESANLRVQEAALTGESEPIEKITDALPKKDLPLGDRRNMVYMGTMVTYGRGVAAACYTGMKTELGHIANMIQEADPGATPLQKRLDRLGKTLAMVALVIVGIVFALGLIRGENARLMFMTAVSMAVAAIPEGLPAVVTIALALGAQRMLKRSALIRKLPAVETLGSVTVICSDKTGTLTENRMTVTALDAADIYFDLAEHFRKTGPVMPTSTELPSLLKEEPALSLLMMAGALCNDASLETSDASAENPTVIGDPTEAAIVLAAAKLGLQKRQLESDYPRIEELPFDSDRKRMTTVHSIKKQGPLAPGLGNLSCIAFTKGALDGLVGISSRIWVKDRFQPMNPDWHKRIMAAGDRLSRNGMRVLGVAFRPLDACPKKIESNLESELVFVGMMAMIDPARPEVRQAVKTCREAGIRPVMITGDHPLTAEYIGRDLGIIAEGGHMLTGQDLEKMSVEDLEKAVDRTSIYARVTPQHKLKIVEALQRRGNVVAMTGDGVNDAPALKRADIGVAMGITGTDVSKEAADMVLLDDNFTTIVAAVEEGRVIFENIRKFIKYLMATNSAEIFVMLLAPFFGMPLPLLPLQILWINLVTDGPAALALGVEPAERNIMRRAPYPPGESIFAKGMGRHIIWVGLLMSFVSLGVGYGYWRAGEVSWQTMVFTTLALSQMGHALAIRSNRFSLFQIGLFSNKPLLYAVLATVALQIALIYTPFLEGIFKTVPLSVRDLGLALGLSTVTFVAVEIEKWLIRRKEK